MNSTLSQRRTCGTTVAIAKDASKWQQVERFVMSNTQQAETVAVRACGACGAGLLESDKFCRWCGVSQHGPAVVESAKATSATDYGTCVSRFTTTALDQSSLEQAVANVGRYHSVSGPLVSALIESLTGNCAAHPRGGFAKRALLALVSLPIWMLIVLLSPFDAYLAAKAISKGI
jgi:hypothetical protein